MAKGMTWMPVSPGKSKLVPSQKEKDNIERYCQPLIDKFRNRLQKAKPDKRFNYLTDVYIKWRGSCLYFCGKYKSEYPNRIADEFEEKIVRLEHVGKDRFNFSYLRHTGQWHCTDTCKSLKHCLDQIKSNPLFQPL